MIRPSTPIALRVVVKSQRHLCAVYLADQGNQPSDWIVTMCRTEAERLLGRPMRRGDVVSGELSFKENNR